MQLPGRLSRSTLGDLLGALHRARTTGLLELREVSFASSTLDARHRIHLEGGLIAGVDTRAKVAAVGEILRRRGQVGAPALHRLAVRLACGDRRLAGEILVAEGLVQAQAVRAALTAQLRDKTEALYRLDDAHVAFHTARPLPADIRRGGPLSPGDFLHGRPRARDRGQTSAPPASTHAPQAADTPRTHAFLLLGLSPGATSADVRRAFRKLASELHPDRFASAPGDEQRRRASDFARLAAAYHLLVA